MIIVSLFLPWWTLFFISTAGFAFMGFWLFGGFLSGNVPGLGAQGGLTSEFAVAAVLVILSGALGIMSTRDRRFSLAGGALGLLGALAYLVKLKDVPTLGGGSVFFGAESAAGASAFWFLSFGFWIAIASSIIMLFAKPAIRGAPVRELGPPAELAAAPPAEGAPPEALAAEVQYCPNCGAPLEPGAKFCIRCGKSMGRKRIKKKRAGKKRIKKRRKIKRKRVGKKRVKKKRVGRKRVKKKRKR